MRTVLALALCLVTSVARADEGLWPLDRAAAALADARVGFVPDQTWLDHVGKAAVEILGCSAAFVSPDGLVLTDRRCISPCLARQAAIQRDAALFGQACRDRALRRAVPLFDLLYCARLDRAEQRQADRAAFLARRRSEEIKCLANDVNLRQVLSVEDVTDRVARAVAAAPMADRDSAERAARDKIRDECENKRGVWCNVRSPDGGQHFQLHRDRILWDVRVVFSPEADASTFAAEGPRFTFPQRQFRAGFMRVYQDGKPLSGPYLPLAAASPAADELLFLAGFPSFTQRRGSATSLHLERGVRERVLPPLAEMYGRVSEQPRGAAADPGGLADRREMLDALSPELLARRETEDRALEARVLADPRLRARFGQAWQQQRQALRGFPRDHLVYSLLDQLGLGPVSDLARAIVSMADRPMADRRTLRWLLVAMPFDAESNRIHLAVVLRALATDIGVGDPVVKKVLQGRTPDEAAAEMVLRTRMPDVNYRRSLVEGGRPAVDASKDPFIALWRAIGGEVDAAQERYRAQVQRPIAAADQQIRQARLAVLGAAYPEGDTNLRLRWGRIAGWSRAGRQVSPWVKLSEVFELATDRPPYRLPPTWIEARPRLDGTLPMVFAADLDPVIVVDRRDQDLGGPVFDRELRLRGMVQGGNESVAASAFDHHPDARAVVLDAAAILEILEKVYRADELVGELRRAAATAAK
jgi:hypothetical protein